MPNAVSRAVGSKRRAWKRGKAGVGSDSGIRDLARRGYSFEDAAEGELDRETGRTEALAVCLQRSPRGLESALTSSSWTRWLVASGIDYPCLADPQSSEPFLTRYQDRQRHILINTHIGELQCYNALSNSARKSGTRLQSHCLWRG
jgi:hypothetical protein